jgi:large subunit ribosomal protein L24e
VFVFVCVQVAKFTRSIVGADADKIRALRSQKPEQRKAARDEAMREIKARKAAAKGGKKGGKK